MWRKGKRKRANSNQPVPSDIDLHENAISPRNGIGLALKITGLCVGILVAVLSYINAYMFNEVTAFPKIYAEKAYVEKAIDSLHLSMDAGFKDIREGMSDINKYLRNGKD